MLSKRVRGKYIVLPDGKRFPVKLNRNSTRKCLKLLQSSLSVFIMALYHCECVEPELLDILSAEVFGNTFVGNGGSMELDDGRSFALEELQRKLEEFRNGLEENNDEILSVEEVTVLEDLGYRHFTNIPNGIFYEKVIEDLSDKEVVEEIILNEGELFRKLRTVTFKITSYGRESDGIEYKPLRMNKKLLQAVKNTVHALGMKWEEVYWD